MGRNIIILLDGTSNQINSNRTNIVRLYGCLVKDAAQLVFYDPGVGTFGGEKFLFGFFRKFREVWGLATGWGLDQNVKDAYRFLVENYRGETAPGAGDQDQIYIYGFSRGAYSARVLAGLIRAVGLIERRNLNLLDYMYRDYKLIPESASDGDEQVDLYRKMLQPAFPPIRFLGLFDTVSSVIEWGKFGPRLRSHAFTDENNHVQSVRHAQAIHERRTMFRNKPWQAGYYVEPGGNGQMEQKQDVKEVWFYGVHGDVGGGYLEKHSAIAKIPLTWMIYESTFQGARFDIDVINKIVLGLEGDPKYVCPKISGAPHRSLKGLWRLLEYLPRRKPKGSKRPALFGWTIPFCEWRCIPQTGEIHQTALDYFAKKDKFPPNLPKVFLRSDQNQDDNASA